MSISRTVSLGVLCGTLTVLGWASPVTAKPVWCEPTASACSRWHAGTGEPDPRSCWDPPAGLTIGQCVKLWDDRNL